ncbi:MAG: NAD(P)-dependent glycerol-1-phosphate dehydrogenase, partial [Candidatus Bathyarchaeia archaeon]
GAIMMAYLHKMNWKRIRDALKRLGAPTNADELKMDKEDIVKALFLAQSIRPERYTILNKLNLSVEACRKIAEATEVI